MLGRATRHLSSTLLRAADSATLNFGYTSQLRSFTTTHLRTSTAHSRDAVTTCLRPTFASLLIKNPLKMSDSDSDSSDTIRRYPVYTRTGDKGTSSLFNGSRDAKDSQVFDSLGSVDELNSHIGVAREYCLDSDNGLGDMLKHIQSVLLDVGSHIATPVDSSDQKLVERMKFPEDLVTELETSIDEMDKSLPPLRNFILPGGGKSSAHLHVCRTVCRRAERRIIPLVRDHHVNPVVQRYLNRLSDYLFVAARFAAKHDNVEETTYKKPRA